MEYIPLAGAEGELFGWGANLRKRLDESRVRSDCRASERVPAVFGACYYAEYMPHGKRGMIRETPARAGKAGLKGQLNMGSRSIVIGRSACAAALSCILALSPALASAEAWADTPEPEKTSRGGGVTAR